MHKCPIEGCQEQVEDERLGCKAHWYMASDAMRQRVLTTWRSVFRSQQFRNADAEERLRRTDAYRQAREQWANEVHEKMAEQAHAKA